MLESKGSSLFLVLQNFQARQGVQPEVYNCAEHSATMSRMCESQADGTYRGVVVNHAVDIPMFFSADAESEGTGGTASPARAGKISDL